MSELSNISVILPSLDPDDKLLTVIDGLLSHGFTDIILVNDGSKAENLHYFETAAAHPEVHLLHHPENRGKGAALKTAFRWFLENRPEGAGVVTVDGDNQHHPEDTVNCAKHMLETGRLTLGVRDFSQPDVPLRSRSGNRITSLVFKIFVGMTISDTQTGLRAFPRKDVEALLPIAGERFEYETNMLLAMKERSIPFDEVKIRTVYIEENKSSHFRAVRDSWRIYKLILTHFFKFTVSSLLSALVDNGLFALLSHLLKTILTGFALTAIPATIARLASSLMNFFLNKRLVFQNRGSTGKALLRYYALAIPLALLQMSLTYGAYQLFHIREAQTFLRSLIYAIIMVVLYIGSYMIQQRWVFFNKKNAK
ncbi:MAG: bifunctional glycosyltransferase family 2/GtrA family protein [Oscillospiraceae bacterium]|nr:bifunctional glycosyltransferase family 2/GtrA family protein [Oscillospiraceae bacterium]